MANFQNFRNFNIGGYFLNGNNSPVPNVISAPEVAPNINGRILPPQIANHPGISQISSDIHNCGNTFNPYCGDPCPLLGNNPQNFSNYRQGPESSTMHDYYTSSQQQQQKRVYELFEFPGYKVELVITPINNHQFTQSMNAPQVGLDGQALSAQSKISQGSLNSCGSTNNSLQSYMSDNNHYYSQQSNLQNYQNCYNPSQQQQQQTNTFVAPAFVGIVPDNNQQSNCNNANNF